MPTGPARSASRAASRSTATSCPHALAIDCDRHRYVDDRVGVARSGDDYRCMSFTPIDPGDHLAAARDRRRSEIALRRKDVVERDPKLDLVAGRERSGLLLQVE